MSRRTDRKPGKAHREPASPIDAFNPHRQARSQCAYTLGMLLTPPGADYMIPLRHTSDIRNACTEAYGTSHAVSVVSLRELLGLASVHEWRKKGVEIPALGGERIHPHYGVFSPVCDEYIELVADTPLPSEVLAFDTDTGTGVLVAVLTKRDVKCVIGTDQDPHIPVCARGGLARLGLQVQAGVVDADLFPEGRAPLIVCNPPWLPAWPDSPIERAAYDPDSRMLRGFLKGLVTHLGLNGGD